MKTKLKEGIYGSRRLCLEAETVEDGQELNDYTRANPGCTFSGNGVAVSQLTVDFKKLEDLGSLATYIPPTD